ncbi:MAG: methyltransferase domain-containing protein, partial [Alphaproteobacteria bacterium]|nr:methyltransferase domain-containing protein [Alphaproteobacteria bacterium]
MFDFIRKPEIWRAMDAGLMAEIPSKLSFQLKTMQDLAMYALLRGMKDQTIAEIGGGDSRILPQLAKSNRCFNIEPFEGADNGPKGEVKIAGVENIRTTVGRFDPTLKDASFDVVFSVSVVEHVADPEFPAFLEDNIRILKPGGVMYHAIDMYLSDSPTDFWRDRFDMYRKAVTERDDLVPIGPIGAIQPAFTPDMASNPDQIMYGWKKISPSLNDLRQISQSVSLLIG